MKFRTTTKDIKNNQSKNYLLSVGYCDLQHLLDCDEPIAYTSGSYGWNYDVYMIDNYMICTGYRGMPKGLNISYDLIKEYDAKAQYIQYNRSYNAVDFDAKKQALKDLQTEFIKKVREYNGLC